MKYELQLWVSHLLKSVPGRLGCWLRNKCMPYTIGEKSLVWEGGNIVNPSKLTIGHNVSINRGVIIHAGGGIQIEDDVLIGPGAVIYSLNHNFTDSNKLIREQGFTLKSVVIRKNVWIGSRAIILPGVNVGSGSIVAAGSVVTKNVPMNVLVVGNPARIKRYLHEN